MGQGGKPSNRPAIVGVASAVSAECVVCALRSALFGRFPL